MFCCFEGDGGHKRHDRKNSIVPSRVGFTLSQVKRSKPLYIHIQFSQLVFEFRSSSQIKKKKYYIFGSFFLTRYETKSHDCQCGRDYQTILTKYYHKYLKEIFDCINNGLIAVDAGVCKAHLLNLYETFSVRVQYKIESSVTLSLMDQ